MTWLAAVEYIDERYEGEELEEYRDRVKSAVRTLAGCIQFAYRKMDDNDKHRFLQANLELVFNSQTIARDPCFVPQFCDTKSFWLPNAIAQYASELIEGADNYFICRKCLQFSPNTCWIQECRALEDEDSITYFAGLYDEAKRVRVGTKKKGTGARMLSRWSWTTSRLSPAWWITSGALAAERSTVHG